MVRNGSQSGLWLVLGALTFIACTSSPEDRGDSNTSTKHDGGSTTKPTCSGLDGGANVDGGAICTCPDGYELDAGLCHPITCTGCDPNASCLLVDDGQICLCNEGFSGDGHTCTAAPPGCGTCDEHASCQQVDNERRCVCAEGYTGDGQTCTAIPRCAKDSDCSANQRCSVTTGTCHDVVASGADCDDEHPCPFSQGCFPGICGEVPRKCRPGCYPGDASTVADKCSPTSTGIVTFCKQLPADQRTTQNKGGACVPGDNCSVTQQNCPDLPLDRTQPVGPSNPAVPHTCVPVSAYATACYPAGAKKLGGENCAYDSCGDTSAACGKGLICTGLLNDPTEPTTCNKQCSNPTDSPVASAECGASSYCAALYGPGQEKVKTGVCQSF